MNTNLKVKDTLNLKRGKIVLHVCGGAGHKIADSKLKKFINLGDGFAELEFSYIDTSKNNYNSIEHNGPFFQISRKATSGDTEIEGSGGSRITHALDIKANIPEYLKERKIRGVETGVTHIVLFSTSGGSGNTIGTFLIEELMSKNIPTIAFMVGDSSDDLKIRNTHSTLSTLSKKAILNNKSLLTYYVNNFNMNGNITEREEEANIKIQNAIFILSIFLSCQNEDIDQADMNNLINQQDFKGINVPAGIYSLTFNHGNKEIVLPNHVVPTVARTLRMMGDTVDFRLNGIMHHKSGTILHENVVSKIKQISSKAGDSTPLHVVVSNGLLKEEVEALAKASKLAADKQAKLINSDIASIETTEYDDELGMDF